MYLVLGSIYPTTLSKAREAYTSHAFSVTPETIELKHLKDPLTLKLIRDGHKTTI